MLLLLFSCRFVEPPPAAIVLEPPNEVLEAIDRSRQKMQRTDGGAELWRAIDAHGGVLRWERVGPLTATLTDGTELRPSDPDYARLVAPFSLRDRDTQGAVIEPGLTIRLGDVALTLDRDSRRLLTYEDAAGRWVFEQTTVYQGLVLPTTLTSPQRRIQVASWHAANPIPGL